MTRIQVNLDRCTGQMATDLRGAILTMESSYRRLEFYRLATLSTCIASLGAACPTAIEAFSAILKIEKGIQNFVKTYWKEHQATWTTSALLCDVPSVTQKSAFPSFDFPIVSGDATDLASLRSTRYQLRPHPTIYFFLQHKNLISASELKPRGGPHGWAIRWTQ